jgi:hypothetical protein
MSIRQSAALSFPRSRPAPHGKEYASYIESLHSVFRHHSKNAASDMALNKVAVELNDIVSEYGIAILNLYKSIDSSGYDVGMTTTNIRSCTQKQDCVASSAVFTPNTPKSSNKRSFIATKLLQRITGKES